MRNGKVSMIPPDNELSIQTTMNAARRLGLAPVVMRIPGGPKSVATKNRVGHWKAKGAVEVK